ncbi:MAG TPA: hypothetical protein VE242_04645 [Chthoniobacterales bacterium]|nr:hypothetical protein [Chthoniobacterales bacterium]
MQQRNCRESGSTLILVLGAVIIAAMIAVSYLFFADNLRERAGRTLDQDQRAIATEQGILEIEQKIRQDLLGSASIDLRSSGSVTGDPLSFKMALNGQIDSTPLSVTPMWVAGSGGVATLGNGDPFGAALARVQLIDLEVVSKATANGRLSDLQLTATPQIAVREIPVSQFTVYSAGDPFLIASTPFAGDMEVGRLFSESNIAVTGNFSSLYPIVSKGQVTFQGGSLQVADGNSSNDQIRLSANTGSPDFWAAARTQLDSKVITADVLPVVSAPLDEIYNPNGTALNFTLLQRQCDLVVVAQVSGQADNNDGYRVVVVDRTGLPYPNGTSQKKATAPFVAFLSKGDPTKTQVLLAFDYRRLPKGFSGSIYLVAQDSAGNPAATALVVVRGAQTLNGPLSIVSPHPIVIAGDFNQPTAADAPACSIITAQDVQTQASDWGTTTLGPP